METTEIRRPDTVSNNINMHNGGSFNAAQIEEITGIITEVFAALEQERWLADAIAENVADRLAALEGCVQ